MTTTRSFQRRSGCFCMERCHGGVRRVCAPLGRWDDGTPSHMLRPSDAHTFTRSIDEWMRVRKRRRQTGVIDRSSVVAVILVPALLAAAATPAVAQGAAQFQSSQLSLVAALRLGLEQNQQLRVAAFEVAVARAQLAQARAGTAIQGNVQASYTRTEETSVTILGGPSLLLSPNLYDTRLLLQYPLYSGGRVEAQIAMAEANLKGAVATLGRSTQQLIFTIRQGYYQLLLAQAGLDSAIHSVTQAAENLRVARARVASGVSPKFDEVQADVALATARQAQVRARNGVAQGM